MVSLEDKKVRKIVDDMKAGKINVHELMSMFPQLDYCPTDNEDNEE